MMKLVVNKAKCRLPLCLWQTYLLLSLAGNTRVQTETVEACTFESFRASCGHGEVIRMISAQYGRMALGRCITSDNFVGCSNNVLPFLDQSCSGQKECSFEVSDLEKHNTECLSELKMYTKASYSCMRVESQCNGRTPTILEGSEGYISSHTLSTKSCGSARSPWILSAQPGQTINISIIDFATSDNNNFVSCKYVYGYILEKALGINHTICGGKQREGEIYSSKTNKAEIILADRRNGRNTGNFLLHYQILGCPELERPAHAWYRREGNEAVIGCEDNDQEWRLTCTGNTWQGSMGNCTKKAAVAAPVEEPAKIEFDSVIIMTSVAGGAVVVVVITIVIGIVYIKKYRMRKETKQLQKTYATMERELQAYYRPTQADMTLLASTQGTVNRLPALMPADLHANQMMSYPDQCSCATLPSRDTGDVNRLLGGSTEPRQSIYSAVK